MVKTIVMKASQKLYRSFTEALQKLHRSFTEALQKLFLKATIHRTVFLCKLESFAGAVNILGYQYLRISISQDINILGYQYLRISVS
jgi:hypothetical protein